MKKEMVRRARFAVLRVAAAFVVAHYLDPSNGRARRASLRGSMQRLRLRVAASRREHGLADKLAALGRVPRSIDGPPVMISSRAGIPVADAPALSSVGFR